MATKALLLLKHNSQKREPRLPIIPVVPLINIIWSTRY